MIDCYNLTVIKVEGLGNVELINCHVSLDKQIIYSVALNALEVQSTLITRGKVKILLEDFPSSQIVASISFFSSIFERSGFHWLPLFMNENDFINEVPEEVGLPRILIDIQSNILSPVVEITEGSETFEDIIVEPISEDLQKLRSKNIELMIKIIELEKNLKFQKENFDTQIEKLENNYNRKLNDLKKNIDVEKEINRKLSKLQNATFKENFELKESINERDKSINFLKEKIEKWKVLYKEVVERENSILSVLEEKDKEILKLMEEKTKKHELSIYKPEKLSAIKCEIKKIDESVYQKVFKEKQELIQKVNSLENKSEKFKFVSEFDEKVKNSLKTLKLEGFGTIVKELVYNFGTKKSTVLVKNNCIHVRVGGILKTLESYIHHNCSQDLEVFLKNRSRKSVSINHKRSNTNCEMDKFGKSAINKTFDSFKSERNGMISTRSTNNFKRDSFQI